MLATILGVAFMFAAPRISPSWDYLRDSPRSAGCSIVALSLFGLFAIQDAALASLRRAAVVPAANLSFGLAKIALAVGLGLSVEYGHSVFVSWIVPMIVVMIPVNVLLFRASGEATRHRTARSIHPPPHSAGSCATSRSTTSPGSRGWPTGAACRSSCCRTSAPPPRRTSTFTFAIGTTLAAISQAMATSLTVEASRDKSQLVPLAVKSLRRILAIVGLAGIGLAVAPRSCPRPSASGRR